MQPVHFRSATELAHDIRGGRLGARELLEHFLARGNMLVTLAVGMACLQLGFGN